MTVKHILKTKGRDVVTIEADQTLGAAARLLSEKRIGAVVVGNTFRPVLGILSERDIVRAVAARGAAALDEPVSRSMTEKVVTCSETAAVNEVMEIMTDGKFRHLPVVDGGRLTGIISIGDVVKHRVAEIEAETAAMRDYIAMA
ncbi:MAG TPA: CBS domain-containing protein [Microvirga sp.]|jgi:CBS domain-containing protein|nr:CBS domain-containing protein [Microvirga sp.]